MASLFICKIKLIYFCFFLFSLPICCDCACVYVCVLRNMKTINNGNTLLLVTHIARNKHRMLTWPHICFKCSKGMRKRMWTKRKWFHCVLQSLLHHFYNLYCFNESCNKIDFPTNAISGYWMFTNSKHHLHIFLLACMYTLKRSLVLKHLWSFCWTA